MLKSLTLILLGWSLVSFNACSNCQTNTFDQKSTDFVSMTITVTNPDSTTFDVEITVPPGDFRIGAFEISTSYIRPNESLPDGLRNVKFFFRDTAIGQDESIFDQVAGDTFLVAGSIPNEEGVEYSESTPTADPDVFIKWTPTEYIGTVKIISEGVVEFDLIFSDGNESRTLKAVYEFKLVDSQVDVGDCD